MKERGEEKGGVVTFWTCLICFLYWGLSARQQKYSWERQRQPHRHSYKPPERHIPAQCDHFLWKKTLETLANPSVPSHTSALIRTIVFPEMRFEVGHHHQVYPQNNYLPVFISIQSYIMFILFIISITTASAPTSQPRSNLAFQLPDTELASIICANF